VKLFADRERLIDWLKHQLTPDRLEHSLAVADVAAELAMRYGADGERARLAGLVHDAARCLDAGRLLKMASDFGIVVSSLEKSAPVALLHGPVAAAWLPGETGLDDATMLHAIAVHTTGCPGMTKFDAIIYLADYIEPGRPYSGSARARRAAGSSLTEALRVAFDESLNYLMSTGEPIHPLTVEARNDLLLGLTSINDVQGGGEGGTKQ
jgi:predicted HD superfamily hydrolase involved in NAD metabolism